MKKLRECGYTIDAHRVREIADKFEVDRRMVRVVVGGYSWKEVVGYFQQIEPGLNVHHLKKYGSERWGTGMNGKPKEPCVWVMDDCTSERIQIPIDENGKLQFDKVGTPEEIDKIW